MPWFTNKLGDLAPVLRALGWPCWRKTAYASGEEARARARSLLDAGTAKDPSRLCAYRCVHCGHWHVGHTYFPLTEEERP